MRIFTFLLMSMTMVWNYAQTNINFDSEAAWIGFMNVSNLPAPDGDGAYQFGSSWGVADLVAILDTGLNTVSLKPNRINDTDSYWQTGNLVGNKIMDANMYIEDDNLAGTAFTFNGKVVENTLNNTGMGDYDFTVVAFIKVFAADYSSVVESAEVDLRTTSGDFVLSMDATGYTGGEHMQYGFQFIGPNIAIDSSFDAEYDALGSIVVGESTSVSVAEADLFDSRVYPNPTQDVWNINSSEVIDSVEIFDILGKRVAYINSDNQAMTIDASSFDAGTYFATINTKVGSQTMKLIKK